MRALWCLLTAGSQRNMVKSSDPDTNLSGALPFILLYLSRATYIYKQGNIIYFLQEEKG